MGGEAGGVARRAAGTERRTMEYEVKKGKKVGGRLGGMRGRELSPELAKWEAWGGSEGQ